MPRSHRLGTPPQPAGQRAGGAFYPACSMSFVNVNRRRATAARCVSCATVDRHAWVHEISGPWCPTVVLDVWVYLCPACRHNFAFHGATRQPYFDLVLMRGRKTALGILTPPVDVAPDVGAVLMALEGKPGWRAMRDELVTDRARVERQLEAHRKAARSSASSPSQKKPGAP